MTKLSDLKAGDRFTVEATVFYEVLDVSADESR